MPILHLVIWLAHIGLCSKDNEYNKYNEYYDGKRSDIPVTIQVVGDMAITMFATRLHSNLTEWIIYMYQCGHSVYQHYLVMFSFSVLLSIICMYQCLLSIALVRLQIHYSFLYLLFNQYLSYFFIFNLYWTNLIGFALIETSALGLFRMRILRWTNLETLYIHGYVLHLRILGVVMLA